MHPDEATEEIIDIAIKFKKPVAIVPCCVFPKSDIKMTFEEWVSFLKAKHPNVCSTFLNF